VENRRRDASREKRLGVVLLTVQTMRTKVQLNFNELPKESHDSLRDSLMDHISQVSDQTNIVIVTQVSVYSMRVNFKFLQPVNF
jgi:predicted Zn-dependent protease